MSSSDRDRRSSPVPPPKPSTPAAGSSERMIPSVPPSSFDVERLDPIPLKGIAGSPGVAVGPALVLGDLRASFVRRHIHTAQIPQELERVRQAVDAAKRTLREVSERMPTAMRDASPILEAYQMMLEDPALHERVERRITKEKKSAEWAVSEASEEIVAMFGPSSIN